MTWPCPAASYERSPGQANIHEKNLLGGAMEALQQEMARKSLSSLGIEKAFQLIVLGPGAAQTGLQKRPGEGKETVGSGTAYKPGGGDGGVGRDQRG